MVPIIMVYLGPLVMLILFAEKIFYITFNLKEPGLQTRLFQVLRRRREFILRIQLYHAPPYSAGRISYVTQTNAQRFS